MPLSLILFNLMMMKAHLLLPCTVCNVHASESWLWFDHLHRLFWNLSTEEKKIRGFPLNMLIGDACCLVLNDVQSRIPLSQKLPAVQVWGSCVWKKFSCSYSAAATASVQDKRVLSPHVELWTPPSPLSDKAMIKKSPESFAEQRVLISDFCWIENILTCTQWLLRNLA